jgi:hypothetical protein
MKALRRPATDEEVLSELPRRARTPDWFIKVEEFANGGWRVKARDRWGRGIEQTGGDSGEDADAPVPKKGGPNHVDPFTSHSHGSCRSGSPRVAFRRVRASPPNPSGIAPSTRTDGVFCLFP